MTTSTEAPTLPALADAMTAQDFLPLLLKVQAAYGTDAYRQAGKAPVTSPLAMPVVEKAAAAGLLTIDRTELPMMMAGPHVTIAPEGYFVALTEAGEVVIAQGGR